MNKMKTKFKGTQEKWDLQEERFIWGRMNSLLAEIHPTFTREDNAFFNKMTEEHKYNAKLMAEAPNLLEALNELIIGYEKIWKKNYKHAILTPEYRNAKKAMRQAITITETK